MERKKGKQIFSTTVLASKLTWQRTPQIHADKQRLPRL